MSKIELNKEMIQNYSKKIMVFTYSKTNNIQLAEDLSQEILLNLSTSLRNQEQIADLDGFVYTICSYTWSKYLRNNKKHWNNLDVDALFDLQDGTNLEKDVSNRLLTEKLRVEIAYLAKLHREITIMFYYENKTSEEVAKLLNIPHSTVRWHLNNIRNKLKAGMEMMANNLNYVPQRIIAGHDGYTCPEYNQCELGSDRLVDNICLACYGKALTLEEIARTLTVAAGYLENHIKRLVYMDYLRVIDKNKYTTNFFIITLRHKVLASKYQYGNIGPYAKRIYEAFIKRYDRIKAINFLGSDLDKDFVLWAIIPLVTNTLYSNSIIAVLSKNNVTLTRPKRKDGSEHWVYAALYDDTYLKTQTEFSKEIIEFDQKSTCTSIKLMGDGLGNSALQLDSYVTHWRNFEEPDLSELYRIAQIICNNEKPNEFDKLLMVRKAEQGYIKIVDGKPKMLIPYFTKPEFEELDQIFQEIYAELGADMFADYIEKYSIMFGKEIPDFISKEERTYHKFRVFPQYTILYWLADNNLLCYPINEEAKRLCTVVWRNI